MLKNSSFAKSFSSSLGRFLAWIPVHPNSITILSVILAIFGYLTWSTFPPYQIQAFLFFLLAFFFDAIDGAIARAKKLESKDGAFLDGISDRLVEFFLILALIRLVEPEFQLLLVIILFFGTVMTSFVKAYAEHSQLLKHEDAVRMPGLLERAERSILLLTAMLLFIFRIDDIFKINIYFTAALSVLTFLQRFLIVYLGIKFK